MPPMSVKRFIDTNIWLYALFEPAGDEAEKQRLAARLTLEETATAISEQVIAEVCSNLLRRKTCAESELIGYVTSFYRRCEVIVPGLTLHQSASDLRQRYHFSYWDSLIVAAALQANCGVLYTEDLHHGLRIDPLEIVNPFRQGQ
jgi:predicted nucleic acid-binding protein